MRRVRVVMLSVRVTGCSVGGCAVAGNGADALARSRHSISSNMASVMARSNSGVQILADELLRDSVGELGGELYACRRSLLLEARRRVGLGLR